MDIMGLSWLIILWNYPGWFYWDNISNGLVVGALGMILIPIWLPRKPLAESWWFVTPNDKALLGEMVAKIAWSGLPNHCTDDCRHQTFRWENRWEHHLLVQYTHGWFGHVLMTLVPSGNDCYMAMEAMALIEIDG